MYPGNQDRNSGRTSPEPGDSPGTSLAVDFKKAIHRFPASFPGFPGSSPDLPRGQPLSLGSLTPSDDSQKVLLIEEAFLKGGGP